LQRLRSAGLVWPLALVLPALAILLALGTWQMQRKEWKEGLIAQINTRVHQPPIALADAEKQPPGSHEYARVKARGTFRHEAEQFIWEPDPRQGPGYHVYTPLRLDDGRFILVNRGYVTEALKAPSSRAHGQLPGEVEVIGLLREPHAQGMFDPNRDAKTGVWYWRDFDGAQRSGQTPTRPSAFSSMPRLRRPIPVAGLRVARRASRSRTAIWNMPSPGTGSPRPWSAS